MGVQAVRKEVAAAVMPEVSVNSATRAQGDRMPDPSDYSGPTALAAVPKTKWQQQWHELHDKVCMG